MEKAWGGLGGAWAGAWACSACSCLSGKKQRLPGIRLSLCKSTASLRAKKDMAGPADLKLDELTWERALRPLSDGSGRLERGRMLELELRQSPPEDVPWKATCELSKQLVSDGPICYCRTIAAGLLVAGFGTEMD